MGCHFHRTTLSCRRRRSSLIKKAMHHIDWDQFPSGRTDERLLLNGASE